ncbi:hypothetical protein [Echinimonas agarilytica]|uniref:BNR repeat-containing family member n=1 Tax=Echinimonas agarilytica TaxID=1215918 RepID=A0AA41W8K9_9GAMM|nr:hypothetical protein [Echinimonas agarilytica]MCM2680713.1 hypothetical protein [Echinimonas agarilytica]
MFRSKTNKRINTKRPLLGSVLCFTAVLITTACSTPTKVVAEPLTPVAINEQTFLDKRTALIIKHAHNDSTFEALQDRIKDNDSESAEYWRWRIDQYLYGQYPEYQPIYDAFTQGKGFHDIYALPQENLGPKKLPSSVQPELPKGYFTDNLPGNPHTGWHDVNANKVYVVYQGQLTDPYIASYDLKTQIWDGPFKAAQSTLSKGERKIDSHGRPIIEQDTLGHFHIVYGGHGGEREDGLNPMSFDTPHAGGRMLHVVSEKPNDISKFKQVNDITPFASYTNSQKMANGDIYLFTRAGTHKSPWVYYKMKSGSQTFDPPVMITWPTTQKGDPITVDTFYINPEKVSDTEIAISALWHACNFNEIHNKTNYGRLNVYYMKLNTTNDTFYNAQGQTLTLPITLASANTNILAYDSKKSGETSFSTRPLKLESKQPAVAYQVRAPGIREWRMTSFTNDHWQHSQPLPNTDNRTLLDEASNNIYNIVKLDVLGTGDNSKKAMVLYKDSSNNSVFASAIRQSINDQHWRVEQKHLSVAKARIEMNSVRDDSGETISVILNIKKGASQRLYLWHDGKFRPSH